MEQHQGHPPQDDSSGDYEYDQAHEQTDGGTPGHAARGRPGPPPSGRPPEPDGDMSYDEAHQF